jgi:hypothetical protein
MTVFKSAFTFWFPGDKYRKFRGELTQCGTRIDLRNVLTNTVGCVVHNLIITTKTRWFDPQRGGNNALKLLISNDNLLLFFFYWIMILCLILMETHCVAKSDMKPALKFKLTHLADAMLHFEFDIHILHCGSNFTLCHVFHILHF